MKITPFQQKVYNALKLIPEGKVTTYKFLGNFIGCSSSQAIGQALTRNPHAPKVPCHRVIRTDGTIGGYAFGVSEKQRILASEGVYFDTEKCLIDPNNFYSFIYNYAYPFSSTTPISVGCSRAAYGCSNDGNSSQ